MSPFESSRPRLSFRVPPRPRPRISHAVGDGRYRALPRRYLYQPYACTADQAGFPCGDYGKPGLADVASRVWPISLIIAMSNNSYVSRSA